jgi:hypothetical protein
MVFVSQRKMMFTFLYINQHQPNISLMHIMILKQ